MVDAFLELLVDDLICESSDWRGEMGIKVKTESKMSFINVKISSINGVLLDVHGLIEQKLFQFFIELLFFKQFFELFFKVHNIISLEFDSKI